MYKDRFPAVKGHCLIITERHVPDFFNLTKDEILDCMSVLKEQKQILSSKDPSIKGFNVGVNIGITSGQTIMHCHIHLIPRRDGDVDDPVGGVRNVIPGKGNYLSL